MKRKHVQSNGLISEFTWCLSVSLIIPGKKTSEVKWTQKISTGLEHDDIFKNLLDFPMLAGKLKCPIKHKYLVEFKCSPQRRMSVIGF